MTMLDQRTGGEVQMLVEQSYRLFYLLLATVGLAILTLAGLCISIFSSVVKPIKRVYLIDNVGVLDLNV